MDALAGLFILLTFTGLIATGYLWRLYRESRDADGKRSILWLTVASFSTVADLLAIGLLPLAIARLQGSPAPPQAGPVLILTIFVGLGVPHLYAFLAWYLRWRFRRRTG